MSSQKLYQIFLPENKIVILFTKRKEYNKQLSDAFPEIEKVQVGVKNTNHLILTIKERPVIGYIMKFRLSSNS